MPDNQCPHQLRAPRARTVATIVAYGGARMGDRVPASATSRRGTDIAIAMSRPCYRCTTE